jgi:hypothetical protein
MDAPTETSGPQPLVDVVNAIAMPAESRCMAAFQRYTAWRAKSNTTGATQAHLAEGVRLTTELRDRFAEAQRALAQADALATQFLDMITNRGQELVDMGANIEDIERDKLQLTIRQAQLVDMINMLNSTRADADALPESTGQLLFAIVERDAHISGRPVQMQ